MEFGEDVGLGGVEGAAGLGQLEAQCGEVILGKIDDRHRGQRGHFAEQYVGEARIDGRIGVRRRIVRNVGRIEG